MDFLRRRVKNVFVLKDSRGRHDVKRRVGLIRSLGLGVMAVWALGLVGAGCSGESVEENEEDYVAEIEEYRRKRDHTFQTDPFSQLSLIHREKLEDRERVTIGSGPQADLRLEGEGIAPLHAVVEGSSETPLLKAAEGAEFRVIGLEGKPVTEYRLKDDTGFRVGRFNLHYFLHEDWNRVIEVHDTERPLFVNFTGMDRFGVDPGFRVEGEVIPASEPAPVQITDSQGNLRPFWNYGELRFELAGTDCTLELFTSTLDEAEINRGGFMLMFTDETSGKETYPAGRYIYVDAPRAEGKSSGTITVDFNKAFSPPCNYSPAFTCPFPGKRNRLPLAIRAGQKWYKDDATKEGKK